MVGASAWVVDFVIFIVFYSIIGIVWAQTAARITGALVSFMGHKIFVFNDFKFSRHALRQQAFLYLLLWLLSYAISIGSLILLVDLLMIQPIPSKLITEAIIICINFLTMRRIIFSP
ncbi:MAG: GtrA family protein [Candidatus Thiodiazotropha sp. (ex Epidulcina cf. delphinae)]|nr:GtrA family protein [Candidatus Thiodiazotropha sp. (ex Epidulcina cf. delphinae)]